MLEPSIAARLRANDNRILITGAGGWLGMASLELLELALGDDFDRRVQCFGSSDRVLRLRSGREIPQATLGRIRDLNAVPSWLLHYAFLTKDRAETMEAGAYRRANRAIGETVLDALDAIGVEAVFVASSGAAACADSANVAPSMRLYGELKRDEEDRFAAWAEEAGRRVVIARIFNLSGPYINKHGAYALANFILDGLAGHTIHVRAPKQVFRSYVAIRELLSLALALMETEAAGVERFESGGEPLELEAVARAVAAQIDGAQCVRAAITDERSDCYHGDGDAYSALLRKTGIRPVGFEAQLAETIEYLAYASNDGRYAGTTEVLGSEAGAILAGTHRARA